MISTLGKLHIKRFMAGLEPSVAQSVAFGVGSKALDVADTKLQFEVGRADVVLTSLDLVNNKIIYKANIAPGAAAFIYEAAIFSSPVSVISGEFGPRLISSFDSTVEEWIDNVTPGTHTTTNTRVGTNSLTHTPAASATKTDKLSQISLSLDGYSGSDLFVFAFNVGNAFTSAVTISFQTDTSNYYSFALGAQTAGYKVVERTKSSATVTGAPSWANITAITVTTTSTSGGASDVNYDGIRIEDVDTLNPSYCMVARELVSPVFIKESGKIQEIEFCLGISV